jgi:hypothetical protein
MGAHKDANIKDAGTGAVDNSFPLPLPEKESSLSFFFFLLKYQGFKIRCGRCRRR